MKMKMMKQLMEMNQMIHISQLKSSSKIITVLKIIHGLKVTVLRTSFEELTKATILSVSRPDIGDMIPMLLSYTIQVHYKQVKEWFQMLGIVDHVAVVQDDDEPDDEAFLLHHEASSKNRCGQL